MSRNLPAREGEQLPMRTDGQDWLVAWFGPDEVPAGTRHGAAGVCVGPEIVPVLIGPDGRSWGFPAGRPQGDETDEETLRREMREEACVEVVEARLLGYSRGECVQGHELGLVLVRLFCQPTSGSMPQIPVRDRAPAGRSRLGSHALRPRSDPASARIHLRALVEAGVVA